MNRAQRQIIAEKVSSTVRVLELLGLEYRVSAPNRNRPNGNRSPRVVHVDVGESRALRVYNSVSGRTWANLPNGQPIREVRSIEELYSYLLAYRGLTGA